jgi:cell division protein FtsB
MSESAFRETKILGVEKKENKSAQYIAKIKALEKENEALKKRIKQLEDELKKLKK